MSLFIKVLALQKDPSNYLQDPCLPHKGPKSETLRYYAFIAYPVISEMGKLEKDLVLRTINILLKK